MARIGTLAATTAMAVSLTVGATASPSAADCSGPRLAYDATTVDRGETVAVSGEGWVAECWDTFPRPPGDPPRAPASTGIEIHVVQGDQRILVAEGDADDDYRFAVEVPIPTSLDPGPATIEASAGGATTPAFGGGGPVTITVTEAPVDDRIHQPVSFVGDEVEPTPTTTTTGAPEAEEPAASPADPGTAPTSADDDLEPVLVVGGALAALVAIGMAVFGVRRRSDAGSDA